MQVKEEIELGSHWHLFSSLSLKNLINHILNVFYSFDTLPRTLMLCAAIIPT